MLKILGSYTNPSMSHCVLYLSRDNFNKLGFNKGKITQAVIFPQEAK